MRFVALIVLLGLSALEFALPLVTQPLDREPEMRALLYEGQYLQLRADGAEPLRVRGLKGREHRLWRLAVRLIGDEILVDADGIQHRLFFGQEIKIESSDPRGIWLGKRRYRGQLRISGNGEQIRLVNELGIEAYLSSVVGSEMPHKCPLAALQAQAVAARTYALSKRRRDKAWDVKATVDSQVYLGLESETPNTLRAVSTTRSLVLVHKGKLINAVFHSSSGGFTEDSGMVWRYQKPYLVSVPDNDQHSPMHRWLERFDMNSVRNVLPEIGGLDSVEVLSRSRTGRVRLVRLHGPKGVLLLSGPQLRERFGLKSTLVQFERVNPETMDYSSQTRPESRQNIFRMNGILSRIKKLNVIHERRKAVLKIPSTSDFDKIIKYTPPIKDGHWLIRGQGNGHGVGMSQWGAYGLAKRGADFRRILLYYYRGAEVVPYKSRHNSFLARENSREIYLIAI